MKSVMTNRSSFTRHIRVPSESRTDPPLELRPHIRRLPERNARQGFFEAEEIEAVIVHLPHYLQDFVRFGYLSGWRKGEIASLTWDDIDHDARIIQLRPEESKTGNGRVLALSGELWDVIERRWHERGGTPGVFHRKSLPIGDMRKAWKTAYRKAGVPGKLFHDLRRTAVREMVRAGVPERIAMAISGHTTRSIFDRYNIVSEADLREAVDRTHTCRKTKTRRGKRGGGNHKSLNGNQNQS